MARIARWQESTSVLLCITEPLLAFSSVSIFVSSSSGLLASRLRTTGSCLHGFLRLNRKFVECHNSILLSFIVYLFYLHPFKQCANHLVLSICHKNTDDLSLFLLKSHKKQGYFLVERREMITLAVS
jgi:hypothetical protein